MLKTAVLYPYDTSNISLLLHNNLLDYTITHVSSPSAWGYCSKDAGRDLGIITSLKVICDVWSALDKVNALILLEPQHHFEEVEFFSLAFEYLKAQKDVVMLCKLDSKYLEILREAALIYKAKLLEFQAKNIDAHCSSNYTLTNLPVPVIAVVGMASSTNKFETLLNIKESFEAKGYETLCISAKHYGEFLQVESYPDFMFSSIQVSDKIMGFNYYVNRLYHVRKPDIILIEVPGGVFPVSEKIHENFAYQNYLVSNSINFDACIINLLYEKYTVEYIDWIKKSLKQKFNYDIVGYIVSNNMIHWNAMSIEKEACFITIPTDFIKNSINDFMDKGINICPSMHAPGISRFTDNIIDGLTSSDLFSIV